MLVTLCLIISVCQLLKKIRRVEGFLRLVFLCLKIPFFVNPLRNSNSVINSLPPLRFLTFFHTFELLSHRAYTFAEQLFMGGQNMREEICIQFAKFTTTVKEGTSR